jgi:hypothetical protein
MLGHPSLPVRLDLSPERVAFISRRLDSYALRQADDGHTTDQRRADALMDLLEGKDLDTSGAVLHLSVDVDTVAGLADHPGELNGYGHVIARRYAQSHQDAEWRYSVTDPTLETWSATASSARRLTAAMRRTVEARDRICVFPGCLMPAVDCDFDHTQRYADVATPQKTTARHSAATTHPQRHPRLELQETPERPLPMDQPPRPHLLHQRLQPLVVKRRPAPTTPPRCTWPRGTRACRGGRPRGRGRSP